MLIIIMPSSYKMYIYIHSTYLSISYFIFYLETQNLIIVFWFIYVYYLIKNHSSIFIFIICKDVGYRISKWNEQIVYVVLWPLEILKQSRIGLSPVVKVNGHLKTCGLK